MDKYKLGLLLFWILQIISFISIPFVVTISRLQVIIIILLMQCISWCIIVYMGIELQEPKEDKS